ncbi:MAG: efflux transporter outer membrane subunit [Deltaproteobacteria bacterium]|jgi:NodT family efflux transporter outer membrane factor (OMF) lipoprotein|nr:efflux transporter outer membrane subunit [Deltaproteobacteria bacterium]
MAALLLAAASLLLPGCSLAPDYIRPAAPVPSSLPPGDAGGGEDGAPAAGAAGLGLGVFYPEPRLRALVAAALAGNRDLRISYLTLLEARAQSDLARSERFPGAEAMASETVSGGRRRRTAESYSAELSLPGFDLDLFGRLRDMDRAAYEEYLASGEDWRAFRIALVSQVAESYLAWRLAAQKETASERALSSYRDSLAFIERRIVAGQADLLELEQARGQTEFAEARVAAMRADKAVALNSLNLLTGDLSPAGLPEPLDLSAWEPAGLAGEIPSSVLLARPDVLAAEHMLRASHYDIGAARAAFFPSISLTGVLGFMSAELSELFTPPSNRWNFTPAVSLPLFAGGRNRANLDLAEIRRDKAVASYEKAIQAAFREAADALAARAGIRGRLDASRRYLATQRRVLRLAENRYLGGASSYLEVLDAQRAVFEAEMDYLDARRAWLSNSVSLYAALGGGLDPAGLPGGIPAAPGRPPGDERKTPGEPAERRPGIPPPEAAD